MSDRDDATAQAEAITQFIQKRGYLILAGKKEPFAIPDQSVLKILEMIEEEFLVNWINCVIVKNITRYEGTKRKTVTHKKFQVEPCYLKLLSEVQEYYVIDPSYVNGADDEKIFGTTKLRSKTFQLIMKMAGFEWVEFLNFLHIIITQITYSTMQRVMKRNSQVNIKYRRLYGFLLLYCIKMKKGHDVEISSYSLQKILNMIGLNLFDITEMLSINVLVLRLEEIKIWKEKNKRLRRLGSLLSLKKDIEINEASLVIAVRAKLDYASKMRQQALFNFEQESLKGADILQRKREKIALQKKYFKSQFDQDDTFVEIYDIHEKKVFIRKKLIYEIINSTDTTTDEFEVNDYHGKKVTLSRKRLINNKNDDKEEYYPMNYSVQEGTGDNIKIICKPLLVKKKYITLLYEQWKSDKTMEVFENKADDSIIKCNLGQLAFVNLDKAELPMQPKEIEMINTKKLNFKKDLANPYKIFIEYHNKKLMKSHLYDRIVEHPGNFDDYSVINHVDGKPFIVSKKQLRAKPKTAYTEYVEVTYKKKPSLIKKNELEGALLGWNHMSNRMKLNNYNNGIEEEFDFSEVQLSNDREEHKGVESVNELPYQIGEGKEAQETIEKDLIDDDVFYKVPDLNVLVRGKIIKEAKEQDKAQGKDAPSDDTFISIPDNDNKKVKVSKRVLFRNDLEAFYEIEDKDNKKKAYIKNTDLKKGLNDLTTNEIPVEDYKGNKLKVKKSNIRVMKQPLVRMPVQMEPIKARIRKGIKNDFTVIPDENGKQTLTRSEYVPLIKSHQPSVKFDRYEIPNYRDLNCYVSKKDINEIKPTDLEKFVLVKNKKTGGNHYLSRNGLSKYVDPNYDAKEKEPLEFDEYDLTVRQPNQKKLQLSKRKMPLEDIEVVDCPSITSLPLQDEENKMKILIQKRQLANQPNDDNDFIQILNEKKQPILIRKKVGNDILKDSKASSQPRTSYKVINCINDKEDSINPVNINSDSKKTDDVYSLINIPLMQKDYFVNKNKLKDCLNKAENSDNKLDLTAYPNNEILNNTKVTEFDFAKVPNVLLPKQDELKPTIIGINPKDLDNMNKKKDELRKDLENPSKLLIEPSEKKLIKSNLYGKISEHPGNFDDFIVKNHLDDKPLIISKSKLKSKPKTSFPEYIAISDNSNLKPNIVKKTDLEAAISSWTEPSSKAPIKNYAGKTEEYSLMNTKVVTEPDDTLPFQASEGKQIKEALEKDLTEDNEFNYLPEPKMMVRAKIVKGIKDEGKPSNNDEENIVTLPDNNNKMFKVNKKVLFKNDLEPLVEIEDSDSKKRAFVKRNDLEKGLGDLPTEEIQLEDEKGNKLKVSKPKIRVVKQPPVTKTVQMEPIKANIRKGLNTPYVVIPDETNKPVLTRSEYIPLIKSHKSPNNIDRYVIPDYNGTDVHVSKKTLDKIKPSELEDLVKVRNKKTGGNVYLAKNGLSKYVNKDFDAKEKEPLDFHEYDPVKSQQPYNGKIQLSNRNMPLEDIEVVDCPSITSLPPQDEENKMKAIIEKRQLANQPNDDNDFIQVPNEKKQPILIRKRVANDILNDVKASPQPRAAYKVINCINDKEDTINPANINTDPKKTDNVYSMVDIPKLRIKPFYVNKNNLKDCLDKADNSNNKLNLKSYPDNEDLSSASVNDFTYTKVPNVSLPKQEELKPLIRREDLDLMNKKKAELRRDLENPSKLLIEPRDKKLIKSNYYDKISAHPGNFDDFSVKNHYDGFPTTISKKVLKSKPKISYPEYVEVTNQGNPVIIKKTDLEAAIAGWKDLSDRPKIKPYQSNKDDEFNLLFSNISTDPVDDLPYQLGDALDIKDDLSKDMTENNEFVKVPGPKMLIRTTIAKGVKDLGKVSDKDEENMVTIPDNENKKRSINKKGIVNKNLEPFFEIEDKDNKKKTYIKRADLEKGLNDLTTNEMPLEDDKGNKIKVRKPNIRIVKQPPIAMPAQMDQVKLNIRKAMVKEYVVIPDEKGKQALTRSEYIQLIQRHEPSIKFDRYEIPNHKDNNIFVSKKALNDIKPNDLEELVLVKNKKNGDNHYLSKNGLSKYVNKDYDAKEKQELDFDEYIPIEGKPRQAKIQFSKRKLPLEDIEVVDVKSNITLPPQDEERKMKILMERREKANKLNPETDFVQLPNERKQPILIRKKIANEILTTNKSEPQPRIMYRIVNCVKNDDDRISIENINKDPNKTDDVYTMIDIPILGNKGFYVNKNKLKDCLNKADNSACRLDLTSYPDNAILGTVTVIDFDYTKLPDVSLPKQDELKPVLTAGDLDLINKKKAEYKKDLANPSKILIEPAEKKLIKSNAYGKIIDHPSNFDDFTLKNHLDKKPMIISKKALKSKPKISCPEYVELTQKGKPAIVKKNDLEGAIAGWKDLSYRPKIKNYATDKDDEYDLLDSDITTDMADDLPPQSGELKDIKKNLDNDMTEDNEFKMVPTPKMLIRTKIVKLVKDQGKPSNDDDENIITVPDNANNKKNINKKFIVDKDLEPYYEIEEIDTKKKTYAKKADLEKGLGDLSTDEMPLEDDKGNKIRVRKPNIRIVKQPHVEMPVQMEPIKLKIRRAMVNNYTVIPDENNKATLTRKEYVPLITSYQPSVKFDSYEIPNYKDTNFYVSRKALEEIKPEDLEDLVLIKNKKTNSNHYLTKPSLMKYVKKDYLAQEKEELEFGEYDLSNTKPNSSRAKGQINLCKRKMPLEDIEVVDVKSNLTLPPQEEERRMKILIERRDKANQLNPATDFVQIPNQRAQPILIRKKIENDIIEANREAPQPRIVYKVINCIKDDVDQIDVSKINTDPSKTDDVYTMIDMSTMRNKAYYVNKNKLRDCLNKAHNSRCKLDITAYPGHEILGTASVIDFDYTKLPDVSLLPQDDFKSVSTIYVDDGIIAISDPAECLRPESSNMPEGGVENDILEDMDETDKVYSKPKPSRAGKPPAKSEISLDVDKEVPKPKKPNEGKKGIDVIPEKESRIVTEVKEEKPRKPITIGPKKTTFAIRTAIVKRPVTEAKESNNA